MRLVLDTNTVISALLWGGTPGRLIRFAQLGDIELVTSPHLLEELKQTLPRKKFENVLGRRNLTTAYVFNTYFLLFRQRSFAIPTMTPCSLQLWLARPT